MPRAEKKTALRHDRSPKKLIKGICIAAVLLLILLLWKPWAAADDRSGVVAGILEAESEGSSYFTEGSYGAYLNEHDSVPAADTQVVLYAKDYKATDQDVQIFKGYGGSDADVLLTEAKGYVEWEFTVPKTAMYQLNIKYFAYGGNGSVIERMLYLDGEVPFHEAEYISFGRLWKDVRGEISKDLNGNDIRPQQEEVKQWLTMDVKDSSGYYAQPLQFYLTEGRHTIRLVSNREPLMLESFTFYHKEESRTYAQVKAEYEQKGYREAEGETVYIQAEDMASKSEKSNFPQNDRSSSFTQPQEIYSILLNSMGGSRWQDAGSTADWVLTVPESGLYRIALRYRQNTVSGMFVTRRLLIDGEVPFAEMENIRFHYDPDWKCEVIGDGEEAFLFYFEAGREYKLTMEAVLGDTASILRRVDECVKSLNEIYRSILMITGATPDKYRNYGFENTIPETLDEMLVQADKLAAVIEELTELSGERGERIAQLTKMEYIVRRMAEDPDEIPGKFSNFKDNVAALGTWVLETARQPLEIDYFAVLPANNKVPKAEGNAFQKLAYQFQTFLASFRIDYSEMGLTEESNGSAGEITVWLATGRDQQETIRTLINSDFTKKTGISVTLELVNPGTLLPSVLAGTGPDVALSNALGDPINFALRNAVMDISGFENYEEVIKRFNESALVPYQYNGATYALPETQSFCMLFYRTDIFEELGLEVPKTWVDWDNIVGELQKKNMSIGLPHDLNTLLTFMYQQDALLYNNNGESTNLDSREAMLSFQKLVEYYTMYNFPTEYDFVNRFRSGEMPLAIADYTIYNQLSLFAPEIRGNWAMTSVPGTVREDGTINGAIPSSGTAVMMMKDAKDPEAAWKFMDWWTSTEVQAAFCIEMESVINASAKQPTANMEALAMLPWSTDDLENIMSQWGNVKGTPEVPGGYYTSRIVTFAFNKAYNDKEDPSDTLQSYIESLNSELARKRKEFEDVR